MKAAVGDRMVVASARLDGPVRDGEILRVGDAGGNGPYLVRWSDSGRESIFFPGPDAHVEHYGDENAAADPATSKPAQPVAVDGPPHTKRWQVDIYLYEAGESTSATAVLRSEVPEPLRSSGEAHRRPGDRDVPEIGDEVAVARALRKLADRLLAAAAGDIASIEGHPIELTS